MKKLLIFAFAIVSLPAMAQHPVLTMKVDTIYSTVTVFEPETRQPRIVNINPIHLHEPSLYLRRAASAQLWSIGTACGAGVFSAIGACVPTETTMNVHATAYYNNNMNIRKALFVASAACGVASLICYIYSACSLHKASKSMSRFHFYGNGVSIDF